MAIPTKTLLIYNDYTVHYEIIPSVIVKFRSLLNLDHSVSVQIYLNVKPNKSFEAYIVSNFPHVILTNKINNYDYYINCTIYDNDYGNLKDDRYSKKKYIAHEITKRLQTNPNVYFLTTLAKNNFFYADVLPFAEKPRLISPMPIYIVQGDFTKRRESALLTKILDKGYRHKFIIKILCRNDLPQSLNKYADKIILRKDLDFINYHKEFLDAYCILPLITKKTQPQYYRDKLTSTISYALGYKLKCLIDKDLQDIYNLQNVEVFNNINDVTSAFEKTLETYYCARDNVQLVITEKVNSNSTPLSTSIINKPASKVANKNKSTTPKSKPIHTPKPTPRSTVVRIRPMTMFFPRI
jgi:hypothetical protein